MSGTQSRPITEMATTVVRTDLGAQKAIEDHEKGTWIQDDEKTVLFVPDWSQKAPVAETGWSTWQKAAVALLGVALLFGGAYLGYSFLSNQPASSPQPTLIAAPPTPTSTSTSTATPIVISTQPVATVTAQPAITPSPAVITPEPVPTITPAPVVTPAPILLPANVDQILTDEPDSYADSADDSDEERDDDPDVPAQPANELAGSYVGPAEVTAGNGALAALDSYMAGTVGSEQVNQLWPCVDANVICGPPDLAAGDYYVIGFSTAEAPPLEGVENIYQVYYLMTDLDGDWLNNAYATPGIDPYIYLSAQYVVEGGWFGTTAAIGETDYRGPIGPDGETPRYNVPAASRLVISSDPPGGFFIVPQDHIGNWFRVASMWRDFGSTERHILVDAVGAFGNLEMMPVPGRAELPSTLSCVRVDVLAEELDGQPSQLDFTFQLLPGVTLDPAAVVNLTLFSGAPGQQANVDHPGLALEDLGNGLYSFNVGVASAAQHGFADFSAGPDGAEIDLTEELIVLTGAGVIVPSGFGGLVAGSPDCGP